MKYYHDFDREGSLDYKSPDTDFYYKSYEVDSSCDHDYFYSGDRLAALAWFDAYVRTGDYVPLGRGLALCKLCGLWHLDKARWDYNGKDWDPLPVWG